MYSVSSCNILCKISPIVLCVCVCVCVCLGWASDSCTGEADEGGSGASERRHGASSVPATGRGSNGQWCSSEGVSKLEIEWCQNSLLSVPRPACNICPYSPSSIKICGPDVNLRWTAEILRSEPLSWTPIKIPSMFWNSLSLVRYALLICLSFCSCAPRRRPTFWQRKPRSQRRRPNFWPIKQLKQNTIGRGWRSQPSKPKRRRDWWSRRWEKLNNWRLNLLSSRRGGGPVGLSVLGFWILISQQNHHVNEHTS